MTIIDNRTENRDYQLPDPSNNVDDDVLRLIAAFTAIDGDVSGILAALPGKSDVGHGHAIEAITGLTTALSGKASTGHQHALDDLSDVSVAGASNGQFLKRVGTAWQPASIALGDVANLETSLSAKAALDEKSLVIPAGTTAERPAAPAGPRFRYNTTTNEFEGWNGSEWGAIAGAMAANMVAASYVGDGAETEFTLPRAPGTEANTLVFVGGVRQVPADDYTVADDVLTFGTAPGNGVAVDVLVVATVAEINVPASGSVVSATISNSSAELAAILDKIGGLAKAGGTMTGQLVLAPADDGAGGKASLRMPVGDDAPDVQSDGDLWADSNADLRYRRGGADATIYDSSNLAIPDQAEAEAGTATTRRVWTAERVAQAIAALTPPSPQWTELAPVATTSGTAVDWTSIPAGVTDIEIWLDEVSSSANLTPILQLGTGGSPTTSGYKSFGANLNSSAMTALNASGIKISQVVGSADAIFHCVRLHRTAGNRWLSFGSGLYSNGSGDGIQSFSSGLVTLAGTLDIVRLLTTTGTFDAGSAQLRYR